MSHTIEIVRVYDLDPQTPGKRLLVDRLWPRGIKKDRLEPFTWAKELAPSTDLRKWYGHDPQRFEEFQRFYREELEESDPALKAREEILELLTTHDVLLLYAAKDPRNNHAIILKSWLEEGTA